MLIRSWITLFLVISITTAHRLPRRGGKTKRHRISQGPRHQKKYIIEVQDHQTAMKAANPIVDLEDTVRRGINDPLADPRFVMNKINDDFFGRPMTESTLHNSELMSYQGGNRMQSPLFGMNNNAMRGLLPSMPFQQQAAKDTFISRRPQSLQSMPLPRMQLQSMPLPRPQIQRHNSMSYLDNNQNMAQNVAGGLSQGLPGGVAAMLSKGRLASFAKGVSLGMIAAQNPTNQKAASMSRIPSRTNRINRLHNLVQSRVPNKPSYFHKQEPIQDINPLTGLPNDLEDRSYGAVSSITSVSDPPPPLPSTITINTSETTQEGEPKTHNSETNQHHTNYQEPLKPEADTTSQGSTRSETTLSNLSNLHSDKSAPEDNFSSLKAFLDADNFLREKLAGDGIESIDSSKTTKSLVHY